MIIYMLLKPPITCERDALLKNRTVYDSDDPIAIITFAVPDDVVIPPKKERVRVSMMEGAFEMEIMDRDNPKIISSGGTLILVPIENQ